MGSGILFGNKYLDVAFISMFAAQLYKFMLALLLQKKIIWRRLFETGGMPSSHSSSVVALTTAIGIVDGTNNVVFAISVVFAVIVMYDAAGVRNAAGQHAGIINEITEFFHISFDKTFRTEKLKELLGHSRSEVLAGAILGVFVAFAMRWYLLPQ